MDTKRDQSEDAYVNAYTHADLLADLTQLEAHVQQIKADLPEDAQMDAFAGVAEGVEDRARAAGLTHDAFIAINAMLIRHGLLDDSNRIT